MNMVLAQMIEGINFKDNIYFSNLWLLLCSWVKPIDMREKKE